MRTSTPTIVIATRFRRSRRRASAQGLPAASARTPAWAGASPAIAPLVTPKPSGLLHPGLVDEPVELLAEDEVPDALRHEVDVLRREHRRHRRLVGHLLVDARPEGVRGFLVRLLEPERPVHLRLDLA